MDHIDVSDLARGYGPGTTSSHGRWVDSDETQVLLCVLEVLVNHLNVPASHPKIEKALRRFVNNYAVYLGLANENHERVSRMIASKAWAACYKTSPCRQRENPEKYKWFSVVKQIMLDGKPVVPEDVVARVTGKKIEPKVCTTCNQTLPT